MPFRYYALHDKRLIQKIGDNKYSIACCDAESPVTVAFLGDGTGLGLHAEIAAQDIGDKVVTLTLQPLGQGRARFVDKDNKPLDAFRPLMWISLPRKPFSTGDDLEQQTVSTDSRFLPLQQSFDSLAPGGTAADRRSERGSRARSGRSRRGKERRSMTESVYTHQGLIAHSMVIDAALRLGCHAVQSQMSVGVGNCQAAIVRE